jgi:hypothetical protein
VSLVEAGYIEIKTLLWFDERTSDERKIERAKKEQDGRTEEQVKGKEELVAFHLLPAVLKTTRPPRAME